MDVYVLDASYQTIGVVDYCKSVIWTRRYCDVGDFELYLPATEEALELLKFGALLQRADKPESIMRVDTISLTTDEESGDYLSVSGKGIECVIGWRIVWNQTNLNGTVPAAVGQLLAENLISPAIPERKIEGITIGQLCECNTVIQKQITGDNLLDAVKEILMAYRMGFKVEFDGIGLVISIYNGVDRSRRQTERPAVEFGAEYDNMLATQYDASQAELKNVALVAGEGEGISRRRYTVGSAAGLDRREVYVDARDISSDAESGTLPDDTYNSMLAAQGVEALAETVATQSFSGTVESGTNFTFETDYFIGDIVQTTNEYGISMAARITEMIECWDENGYSCTPTFDNKEV